MNGFKVEYKTPRGKMETTWLSIPMSDIPLEEANTKIKAEIIKFIFANAHPKDKITAMMECTLEEFQKEKQK